MKNYVIAIFKKWDVKLIKITSKSEDEALDAVLKENNININLNMLNSNKTLIEEINSILSYSDIIVNIIEV